MQATITATGQVIKGKTLKAIKSQLNALLSVDGPRGLTAVTDKGHEIHVELYEGQDYIRRGPGRPPAAGTQRQTRISATVPPEYADWLRAQGDISATLRRLIEQAMWSAE